VRRREKVLTPWKRASRLRADDVAADELRPSRGSAIRPRAELPLWKRSTQAATTAMRDEQRLRGHLIRAAARR
jgi:hypothetical protein